MVVGTAHHSKYHLYRCPTVGDCRQRVTISANLVEGIVVGSVRELLEGVQGTASIVDGLEEAERVLAYREQELDAAVRAFSGLDDVDAARERLLELRAERDAARERVEEVGAAAVPALTVTVGDWDNLTIDERRALIRAVIDRVEVLPGRGGERVTVYPRGE
jgi:hypothetical protein